MTSGAPLGNFWIPSREAVGLVGKWSSAIKAPPPMVARARVASACRRLRRSRERRVALGREPGPARPGSARPGESGRPPRQIGSFEEYGYGDALKCCALWDRQQVGRVEVLSLTQGQHSVYTYLNCSGFRCVFVHFLFMSNVFLLLIRDPQLPLLALDGGD